MNDEKSDSPRRSGGIGGKGLGYGFVGGANTWRVGPQWGQARDNRHRSSPLIDLERTHACGYHQRDSGRARRPHRP